MEDEYLVSLLIGWRDLVREISKSTNLLLMDIGDDFLPTELMIIKEKASLLEKQIDDAIGI